jgi:hypothetical protein
MCIQVEQSMSEAKTVGSGKLLTAISVTIMVGVEVFGLALAGGWALGGLMELGQTLTIAITVVFVGLGAWAMWKFWRQAWRIEFLGR